MIYILSVESFSLFKSILEIFILALSKEIDRLLNTDITIENVSRLYSTSVVNTMLINKARWDLASVRLDTCFQSGTLRNRLGAARSGVHKRVFISEDSRSLLLSSCFVLIATLVNQIIPSSLRSSVPSVTK